MSVSGSYSSSPGAGAPEASSSQETSGTSSSQNYNSASVYCVVFYELLDSLNIQQSTIGVQSEELSDNAAQQEKKNNAAQALTFKQVPPGAGENTINQIQTYNQGISAQRDNIQNQLITMRQEGQVEMTETNANVGSLQQSGSMISALMQSLNSITQVICRMTGL